MPPTKRRKPQYLGTYRSRKYLAANRARPQYLSANYVRWYLGASCERRYFITNRTCQWCLAISAGPWYLSTNHVTPLYHGAAPRPGGRGLRGPYDTALLVVAKLLW